MDTRTSHCKPSSERTQQAQIVAKNIYKLENRVAVARSQHICHVTCIFYILHFAALTNGRIACRRKCDRFGRTPPNSDANCSTVAARCSEAVVVAHDAHQTSCFVTARPWSDPCVLEHFNTIQ